MADAAEKQIILITGATNGIGLDTARHIANASSNYHVIIGARDPSKGDTILKDLLSQKLPGTLSLVQLDQTDDSSISAAVEKIERNFGRLDILINNAGVCPEDRVYQIPSRDIFRATFETNVFGPAILTEALVPLLKKSQAPRIINVSSTMGSIGILSENSEAPNVPPYPAYRMSKSALNMMTAFQYSQLKPFGFKIWSYCPGYVVTDLGRDRDVRVKNGIDSSETSAVGIIEIVEGKRDAEVGGFVGRYGLVHAW